MQLPRWRREQDTKANKITEKMLYRKQRRQLNFLITAGGTREYIDPVRFISNASSGKMGYELARAAAENGNKVTLITAPANMPLSKGVRVVEAESAAEMFEAVKSRFNKCDCLIMAAAVSDYTPVKRAPVKIKRDKRLITLKLKPAVDILKWAGSNKSKRQIVIGFALEDKNLRAGAEKKFKDKNLDVIVANRPSAIGAERSSVWIKSCLSGWMKINNKTKAEIAGRIIGLAKVLLQFK
jgi:phosphopantothenoylcysteine decarboxylase/phosphopantothenate--cysteine ligase